MNMVEFPVGIRLTRCEWRSHTIVIYTRHGIVKWRVPVHNAIIPLKITKRLGGYS